MTFTKRCSNKHCDCHNRKRVVHTIPSGVEHDPKPSTKRGKRRANKR